MCGVPGASTKSVAEDILVTFATWWPWHLGEPADSFRTPEGIKPEWYFLPMYQFLKYFDDNLYSALPFLKSWGVNPAFLGVLTINAVGLALFLLPVLDRGKERKITRRPVFATIAFLLLLAVVGMGFLGYVSERELWGYHFSSKGYPTRVEETEKASADGPEGGVKEEAAQEEPGGAGEEGGGGGPAGQCVRAFIICYLSGWDVEEMGVRRGEGQGVCR